MTIITEKICTNCNINKPIDEFYIFNRGKHGRTSQCKKCMGIYRRDYFGRPDIKERAKDSRRIKYQNDLLRNIYRNAKARAKLKGLEFNISLDDIKIPIICPYLEIRLEPGSYKERSAGHAPTIDRIDSTKGYVPDNIEIISDLANRMKSNATKEQLITFAKNILAKYTE